ncbi:AAA family ATPase [Sphingobacterium multivorum]|uniref:AAA family ATPase n=1 Tax=Sphingobacterium multivorum TaxID=28454 RepID=UPI00345E7355
MSENTLYNPASLDQDQLITNFIVRTEIFEELFEGIVRYDSMGKHTHYLIQGQRGMGKTTLLLRLKYEIERQGCINDSVIPVFFNEESYDVNSLSTLWEKLLKHLDDHFDTHGLFYDTTENFVDDDNYEELCYNYLIAQLLKRNKRIVLFFDNFGELFLDVLKPKDKERLYLILNTSKSIQIVGATAVVINDFSVNGSKFLEVFEINYLRGLNTEETFELISKLQKDCVESNKIDLNKSKSKIETLSILTGGVIRTIMMLYQVLLDDPYGKALHDLEKILDKVTPLYKHRIEDLPLQQRKIVDVIAKKWDATSAKEIAGEIREDGKRVASKIISAQLNQLEKNNIVEKKTTTTKNNLYQIRERFFNIWYLMRSGDRRDRKRVAWLTKFLEIWYDDEDSQDLFIKNHISAIRSGSYVPSSALLVFEALAYSEKFDPLKLDDMLKYTSKLLDKEDSKHLPGLMNARKISAAISRYQQNRLEDAINILTSVNDYNSSKILLLSQLYIETGEKELARNFLNEISVIKDIDVFFFEKLCKFFNSFDLFFKIIELNRDVLCKDNTEFVVGEAYLDQNLFKNADEHFQRAYDLGNEKALEKLILVNVNLENYQKAEDLLIKGYENNKIEISDLLNFYSFAKKDVEKLEKYLAISPKNGDYYLHSALLQIESESEDTEAEEESEIPPHFLEYLQRCVELYLKDNKKLIESNNFNLAVLLLLYHYVNEEDFEDGYDLILKVEGRFASIEVYPYLLMKAIIYVVKGIENKELLISVFREKNIDDEDMENLNFLILLLLAKSEFAFLQEVFLLDGGKLREMFKPTYYVLMTYLNEEFPDEVIRMGDELKVPMEDIMEKVEELKIDYK